MIKNMPTGPGNGLKPDAEVKEGLQITEFLESYEKEHGLVGTLKLIYTRIRDGIYETSLENTSVDSQGNRPFSRESWADAAYTALNAMSVYLESRRKDRDEAGFEDFQEATAVFTLLSKNAHDTMYNGRKNEQYFSNHVYTQKQLVTLGMENPIVLEKAFDDVVEILSENRDRVRSVNHGNGLEYTMAERELTASYKEITGVRAELIGYRVLNDIAVRMSEFINSEDFKRHITQDPRRRGERRVGENLVGLKGSRIYIAISKPVDDMKADMDFYMGIESPRGLRIPLYGIGVEVSDNPDDSRFIFVSKNGPANGDKETVNGYKLIVPKGYARKKYMLGDLADIPQADREPVDPMLFSALDQVYGNYIRVTPPNGVHGPET